MLLNSTAKILSSSTDIPLIEGDAYTPSLKDNFDYYKACAIKLNLLADSCPETPSEQAEFERVQTKCIKGQSKVLKSCGRQLIETDEDARYMMALWQDEVLGSQAETLQSDTDRMVVQLFKYFKNSINQT